MGASTGIFGIFGTALGFLVFNWNNLEYEGSMRGVWMCQIMIIVIMSFLLTAANASVLSHAGGFISGFFVGLWFSDKFERPGGMIVGASGYEKGCRISGYIGTAVVALVPLLIMMLV